MQRFLAIQAWFFVRKSNLKQASGSKISPETERLRFGRWLETESELASGEAPDLASRKRGENVFDVLFYCQSHYLVDFIPKVRSLASQASLRSISNGRLFEVVFFPGKPLDSFRDASDVSYSPRSRILRRSACPLPSKNSLKLWVVSEQNINHLGSLFCGATTELAKGLERYLVPRYFWVCGDNSSRLKHTFHNEIDQYIQTTYLPLDAPR